MRRRIHVDVACTVSPIPFQIARNGPHERLRTGEASCVGRFPHWTGWHERRLDFAKKKKHVYEMPVCLRKRAKHLSA